MNDAHVYLLTQLIIDKANCTIFNSSNSSAMHKEKKKGKTHDINFLLNILDNYILLIKLK